MEPPVDVVRYMLRFGVIAKNEMEFGGRYFRVELEETLPKVFQRHFERLLTSQDFAAQANLAL